MTAKKPAGAPTPADAAKTLRDEMRALARNSVYVDAQNEYALYANTRDGRFLWRAFLLLHRAGKPIPKAFLDKFAEWGEKVIGAESPAQIASALQLSGTTKKHVGVKQGEAYRKRWLLASEVLRLREFKRLGITDAIAAVALSNKLTFAKVKKDYYSVFPATRRRSAAAGPDLSNIWRR
jgi:hypothetical protein